MDKILKLEKEVTAMQDAVYLAQLALTKAKDNLLLVCLKYWKQRYGIAVGETVYLEGVEGIIEEVCPPTSNALGKPTVVLTLRKRNGDYCDYSTTTYGEGPYSYKLKSEMEAGHA